MSRAFAAAVRRSAGHSGGRRRTFAAGRAGLDRAGLRVASCLAGPSTEWRCLGRPGAEPGLRTGTAGAGTVHVRAESAFGRSSARARHALVLVLDRPADR